MAIINQRLEERTFISFEFDTPKGKVSRLLPFTENVLIRESKAANYVTYKPLGRGNSLYAYSGSDSRKVTLGFAITLPHIIAYTDKNSTKLTNSLIDGNEYFKSLFFKNEGQLILNKDTINYEQNVIAREGNTSNFDDFYKTEINPSDLTAAQSTTRKKCIDIIMFWVSLVRNCVVSNQEDPIYGPPLVRLTYGILYKDVPFLCMDYSISIDESAGYDARTLLPRKIVFELNLLENRTGNYGTFDPGNIVRGDNNSGWEVIFDDRINNDPSINFTKNGPKTLGDKFFND